MLYERELKTMKKVLITLSVLGIFFVSSKVYASQLNQYGNANRIIAFPNCQHYNKITEYNCGVEGCTNHEYHIHGYNCGVEGCTNHEYHTHGYNCGVEGCTNHEYHTHETTGNHQHLGRRNCHHHN